MNRSRTHAALYLAVVATFALPAASTPADSSAGDVAAKRRPRPKAEPRGTTRQATSSAADTTVQRFGPPLSFYAALRSTGDLLPSGPGNADGSTEVFRLDLKSLELLQCSASDGDTASVKVTIGGDVILSSTADLTPGQAGNADGSFESWVFEADTRSLRQISASLEDTFFQTFWDERRQAFFVSRGDLTPGAPGNTDRQNQVFSYDVSSRVTEQLTAGDGESLIRAICGRDACGVVQSGVELVPGGNPDGSREIYLLDLGDGSETRGFRQLTSSGADAFFRGQSVGGRYLAFESRGDLVPNLPGNTDGSQEVFVYDTTVERLYQITNSAGDSDFANFLPVRGMAAIESRQDLVPGGNTDGSQEVYFADLETGNLRQATNTAGDSRLVDRGARRGRFAAIASTGDLRPDIAGGGTGTEDYYVFRLRALRTKTPEMIPVVRGVADAYFIGLDRQGRYAGFDTTADIVPGSNTDGSREVFLTKLNRRRTFQTTQITSGDAESRLGGFASDGRRVLIESRADLTPAAPGNADGSREIFVHRYR